jgi:hypothetical protein
VNSSNQQGNFQNQRMFSGMQSNQNQSNPYQPLGFVQSHYQGIPNQQTGRQSAGPVISHVGYSAASQQGSNQGYAQQNAGFGGSFAGSRSNQSNAFANNFGSQQGSINNQPVISRVGYTAGQNFQPNQSQQNQQMQPYSQQNQQMQSYSQPQRGFAGSNQGQNQFNAQAVTQYNPVYQATNAASQDGPIISRVGYSMGNQQSGNQQSGNQQFGNQQFSQNQNFGMNQRF